MAHIEQLKQLVKSAQVPKVLGLGGEEPALVEEALTLLREQHRPADPEYLNHHRYEAGQIAWNSLFATLQTPPFLGSKRLVELCDAEKIDTSLVPEVISYIKDAAPFSLLVMVFNKVDKRNKLLQALEEQHLFFNAAVDEKLLASYINSAAQDYGMKLDHEVVQFLLMALDNDLLAIKNAIKKLSLIFEQAPVSVEEAALHVVGAGMQDVFKLARAISEGDLSTSLKKLGLIREQENALKFLGVLSWQFRILVHIRHCLNQGMADWDIRQEVSVYGDRFSWMLAVAKKRPIAFHISRLTRLLQCDLMLKSQKTAEPFNFIERLIYQSAIL